MKKNKKDLVILWIERDTRNKLKEISAQKDKSMLEYITEIINEL